MAVAGETQTRANPRRLHLGDDILPYPTSGSCIQERLTTSSYYHGADFLHTILPGISSHRVPNILTVNIGEPAIADEAPEDGLGKVLGNT